MATASPSPNEQAAAELDENPSFEIALATLQQITARLEAGRDGLESSLIEFERGVKLLRICYQLLENAEQKIEQLVSFNDSGEPELASFDATATAGQPAGKRQASKRKSSVESPKGAAKTLEFDEE